MGRFHSYLKAGLSGIFLPPARSVYCVHRKGLFAGRNKNQDYPIPGHHSFRHPANRSLGLTLAENILRPFPKKRPQSALVGWALFFPRYPKIFCAQRPAPTKSIFLAFPKIKIDIIVKNMSKNKSTTFFIGILNVGRLYRHIKCR